MTRTMYDAAYPPVDPHLDVCAFYIGGDTPHVWSDEEIAAQSARWRLPIYTCDNPAQRDPTTDAASAVAWMRAHGVPAGSTLALDYEAAKDPSYLATFDADVIAAGWRVLLYGSLSTVEQNPAPSAGYWTASWTGVAHLDAGAAATQWTSDTQLGKPYDLSQVADSLVLWDTKGTPQMEQTDTLIDATAVPGRTIGNVLADWQNWRDWNYGQIGVFDGANPPDNNSRAAKLYLNVQAIADKVNSLADPKTFVAAFVADTAAMDQLATAIAAKLPQQAAPPTAAEIASAVAAHFGADLSKG